MLVGLLIVTIDINASRLLIVTRWYLLRETGKAFSRMLSPHIIDTELRLQRSGHQFIHVYVLAVELHTHHLVAGRKKESAMEHRHMLHSQ